MPAQGTAATGHGQSFAEAHRALLGDSSLQFHFEELRPPPPPPGWLYDLVRFLALIANYLQWVFWAGLAALVAALVFVVVREIITRFPLRRAKAANDAAPVVEFRPTAARARALLEEADRLAGEGRYSEAARVLLHRSIDDLERTHPISISAAMTSREIARIERLSSRTRSVFSSIARAVEVSLFGGRELNAGQYQECRRIYESFAFEGAER